jgi:ATP-dependent helicase/nuclease subunit A
VQERFLSNEERTLIDPSLVVSFLQSWWGRKLIAASNVLREFKFSILDDALEYGCDIPSERILLQGVVDCAIVEEEGIYILDFKTDRIHDSNRNELIRVYSSQVRLYSRAMERIFERKVLQASLYFFRSGEFVQIEL